MADLDELLYGDKTEDMAEVLAALREGYSEYLQVELIRRYLITPEQRRQLFDAGACEHDLLNCRIENFDMRTILDDWNTKLGAKLFV